MNIRLHPFTSYFDVHPGYKVLIFMKIMGYLVKLNIFVNFLDQNLMLFSCGKSGTQLATCPVLRFEESWLFRQRFRTTRIAAQPFMCQ